MHLNSITMSRVTIYSNDFLIVLPLKYSTQISSVLHSVALVAPSHLSLWKHIRRSKMKARSLKLSFVALIERKMPIKNTIQLCHGSLYLLVTTGKNRYPEFLMSLVSKVYQLWNIMRQLYYSYVPLHSCVYPPSIYRIAQTTKWSFPAVLDFMKMTY